MSSLRKTSSPLLRKIGCRRLKDNSNAFGNKRKLNLGKDQGKDTSEKTYGLSRWAARKVEMGSTIDEEEEQAVAARGSWTKHEMRHG
jgi:hypothetical protein